MKVEGVVSLKNRIEQIYKKSYPICAAYALVYEHDCYMCFNTCACNCNTKELQQEFGDNIYRCIHYMHARKVK